jgi:acetyltransferase-like isoleucine patch superfamily enzyme
MVSRYEQYDYMPWLLPFESEEVRSKIMDACAERKARAAELCSVAFGDAVFLAETARLFTSGGPESHICIGAHSYVAAYARIYNRVTMGAHCSVNTHCMLDGGDAGIVIGRDTRIGADVAMFAFEHNIHEPGVPFRLAGFTSKGIVVGNDVGVGTKAVILDGVTVGDHAFIGAGSVVRRNVAPYAIIAGNPARQVGSRRIG